MHPLPPPLSLLLSQAALGAPAGCSGCRCPPSSRPGALLGGMRQPEDLQGCPVCVPISCPHVHPVTITFLFHPVLSLAPHNNCPSSAQTCPASPPIPVPSPPRPCLCSHSYHHLICIPRIPSNLVQFQMFPWQLCHTVGHLLRVCLQWDEGTPCVPGSAALPAHGTPGAGNPEDPSVTPLGPSQTLQAPQPIPPSCSTTFPTSPTPHSGGAWPCVPAVPSYWALRWLHALQSSAAHCLPRCSARVSLCHQHQPVLSGPALREGLGAQR